MVKPHSIAVILILLSVRSYEVYGDSDEKLLSLLSYFELKLQGNVIEKVNLFFIKIEYVHFFYQIYNLSFLTSLHRKPTM